MSELARRYAKAACEVAEEKGGEKSVEALARQIEAFAHVFGDNEELARVLTNPALGADRNKVLDAVLKQLKCGDECTRLVQMLAERDRIGMVHDVAREIDIIADERTGKLHAEVFTAISLAGDQEKRIENALQKRFGRPVSLTVEVDESILGGLVVQVGDVKFDSSVRRQLEKMRESLEANI